MRIVNKVAVIDEEKCTGCGTCVKICPVEAIRLEKNAGKRLAVVDKDMCLGCTICFSRCPEYAVKMVQRESPLRVGIELEGVSEKRIAEICQAAHMFPEQIVCYCRRITAKEIAAAIIQGAKTPEDISRATAARTGCGVLCISGVIRLLRAAGIKLNKASGAQWYGAKVSIWDLPKKVQEKYSEYYIEEDLRDMNNLFPGGEK